MQGEGQRTSELNPLEEGFLSRNKMKGGTRARAKGITNLREPSGPQTSGLTLHLSSRKAYHSCQGGGNLHVALFLRAMRGRVSQLFLGQSFIPTPINLTHFPRASSRCRPLTRHWR